jgi:hypothetical protein
MKEIFILSMVIAFAVICSCQKQDAVAEQQLAQRKVELDAREDALVEREKVAEEREKALDEREKALTENEKSRANVRTISPNAQSQDVIRDAAEAKAERDRRIQQLPAEIRALIPDPSQLNATKAEKDRRTQERLSQRQGGPEKLQSEIQRKLEMSGAAVSPAVEAASAAPSPAVEAASATPSPTPQ